MDGVVIWVTGLSGSGKTTLSRNLISLLKNEGKKFILLDGDELREILSAGLVSSAQGYDKESRKNIAKIYSNLARNLASQGFNVVVSTISMFDEVREFNAKNITNYFEVYLEVSDDELRRRNSKGLYGDPLMVKEGCDYELPKSPEYVIRYDEKISINQTVLNTLKKVKDKFESLK